MSTLDLTAVPNFVAMQLQGNTAVYTSPLVASQQTLDRGGLKWRATYTYTNLRNDVRADMMGLLAALRSQANRMRVPVYDNPIRGAYGGTPIVDGSAQVGSSINLRGLSNNITDWIKAGDYFSVDVNGVHELKMCTADASSNGTGLITVPCEPRLRASPIDAAAIWVEDGVLPKPQGVFLLSTSEAVWSSQPGIAKRSNTSLEMIEDVFATQ